MAEQVDSKISQAESNIDVDKVTQSGTKPRRVKRVIHCSDGVYEEYSSDEEGVIKISPNTSLVDPKHLAWGPWLFYLSSKALAACDYVGETLTDFLGITTPKYLYEIQEAQRMKEEEESEKKRTDVEMAGWGADQAAQQSSTQPQVHSPVSIHSQPAPPEA